MDTDWQRFPLKALQAFKRPPSQTFDDLVPLVSSSDLERFFNTDQMNRVPQMPRLDKLRTYCVKYSGAYFASPIHMADSAKLNRSLMLHTSKSYHSVCQLLWFFAFTLITKTTMLFSSAFIFNETFRYVRPHLFQEKAQKTPLYNNEGTSCQPLLLRRVTLLT